LYLSRHYSHIVQNSKGTKRGDNKKSPSLP
jgi:hypothetical protein